MNHAYAQGYGLALALDAKPDWNAAQPEIVRIMAAIKANPSDASLKRDLERVLSPFAIRGAQRVGPGGGDDLRTMVFGKKLNERMGANAAPHPAKHEVARAEVAGKTGITGGPPTNKGSKVPAGKQPLILPKMSWPSSDANGSGEAKKIIEQYDRKQISRTKAFEALKRLGRSTDQIRADLGDLDIGEM